MIVFYLLVPYTLLIIFLIWGIEKNTHSPDPKSGGISVLIPFRNEADRIQGLLKSIQNLSPSSNPIEFLFIDDYSQDDSVKLIENHLSGINFKILSNSKTQGKKQAIECAISQAEYHWIFTTDADCQIPPDFFRDFEQESPMGDLIAGPVLSFNSSSFQGMNFLSLSAYGDASSYYGQLKNISAANLFYKKSIFEALNPYADNIEIQSGDDVFLAKAFSKANKKMVYWSNHNHVIRTTEKKSFQSFFSQQYRWTSKTASVKSGTTSAVALVVWLSNLSLIISLFIFDLELAAWLWLSKIVLDYIYFNRYYYKIQEAICLRKYLLNAVIYPWFASVLGFMSLKMKKKWD
ncbi:glycosyltransferase [Flavobacteriaceae bacterium]|nr:glycosyltransferase [Flavobacteriaceae bacterium]